MKQFVFFITLFFVLLVLVSCANRKPQEPVVIEKTREVHTVVKDTIFRIEADSTYYHAFIECINGQPVLKEAKVKENRNDKSESGLMKPKVSLTQGSLSIECYKQAQESFKTWRETYIKEHEQTPIYIEKPIYKEKALSWFQTTQIWLGRIFLGVLALFALVLLIRWNRII
ncbi:hypothetical protein [Chryseobacterium vrystaatense]|uniref:Lipoprotein n=1 Tax=Chryseobacterium vrystaatense TaxID=307480 RepID=A0A1M5AMY9_9FLAO|nr:hypothetical protein [Chryseobacterium vrystaatense]SHF31535.1 hypothetical protein SAMN02787073_1978 [Chryseobacterium vrystaatense]